MIRYTHESLASIRAEALIVEVDCLGTTTAGLWPRLVGDLPEVQAHYLEAFRRGDVEPGSVLRIERRGSFLKSVFVFPTRVHPAGEVRPQVIDGGLDSIVHQMLESGAKSVAFGPMGSPRGLDWPEVRRRLLFAFSRVPEIDLIGLFDSPGRPTPVTIFTDGGAEPNPGRGGYGVVLRFGSHRKELSGGFQHTSNDRMELLAAVEGLEALKQPCHVQLHSDSRYVVDMVNGGALFRVAARDWKKSKTKNVDLWRRFLNAYIRHDVELVWVKGHSGIQENERCDALASQAIKENPLAVDHGFVVRKKSRKPRASFAQNTSAMGAKPAPAAAPSPPQQTTHRRSIDPVSLTSPQRAGDLCRHCRTPLVKRIPKRHKADAAYHYAWYLFCEGCRRFYYVEEAKVLPGTGD